MKLLFGLGTYQNNNLGSIQYALENGYDFVDTAVLYKNHSIVGQAIVNSRKPRNKLTIQSKVHKYHLGNERKIIESINQSLEELQIDYLDSLLLHMPDYKNPLNNIISWQAIEKLVEMGKVKTIGLSNYSMKHMQDIFDNKDLRINPKINQIELHPSCYKSRLDLIDYCLDRNIHVQTYGLLRWASKYEQQPQHPILWALNKGLTVIPKSENPEHITQNINIFKQFEDKTYDSIPDYDSWEDTYEHHLFFPQHQPHVLQI